MNTVALVVFIALFLAVAVLGFAAARWRRGDLTQLHEWGLGGRRFGTWVTWFLLGGDLYTAYTFIAVPALMFGAGAIGFFAVPYTILVYPILYLVFPRLWSVCAQARLCHGGGFRARALRQQLAGAGHRRHRHRRHHALYRAAACRHAGGDRRDGHPGAGLVGDLPLIIAFVILAAFTYTSGLRAPAMIAVVKDLLIYLTVIAAIIVIPTAARRVRQDLRRRPAGQAAAAAPAGRVVGQRSAPMRRWRWARRWPCSCIRTRSPACSAPPSARVIRRNAAMLPAYSMVLGLLALLGFMAVAAGVAAMPEFAGGFKRFGNNFAVPALFLHSFPSWFVGVAFAAIAIGALVPAAIMSIASANIFTRNIYREFINPICTDAQESRVAKIVSLVVKAGALVFIFVAAAAIRAPAPVAGRRLDHPDAAVGDARAVHRGC